MQYCQEKIEKKHINSTLAQTVLMLEENIELEEKNDSNMNEIEIDGQNQVVTGWVKSFQSKPRAFMIQ